MVCQQCSKHSLVNPFNPKDDRQKRKEEDRLARKRISPKRSVRKKSSLPKLSSFTTRRKHSSGDNPKSWVLEVSNDGSEGSWAVVDSRDDNNDLNDKHVTRNFALGTPQGGSFRFVRLRQTGKNHYGNDHLIISALELFGVLSRE